MHYTVAEVAKGKKTFFQAMSHKELPGFNWGHARQWDSRYIGVFKTREEADAAVVSHQARRVS